MQIENCFVENLFEECRDGLVFLRVCARIDSASVDWKKPNMTPKNPFHKNANCDLAEESMRFLGVKMIGVGAQDIANGHRKNILAIVWQLMRIHYLKIIGSKTEGDLIAWVNQTVQPETDIKTFSDPQFGDGKILIKLAGSIEPRIINQELITPGVTDEDKEMNAKYAISIARKLGVIIFMVWDDIPRLNKKMLLIFVCSLYDIKHQVDA
jgi:plastin-1